MLTVVGARPNFMKAAPIVAAVRKHNACLDLSKHLKGTEAGSIALENILVHTGQHYDEVMSDQFFADLNLPKPEAHLGVGSASHAIQTAEIMKRFEEVLLREKPDLVVVVGDVNSTLACSLVASKISYDANGTRPLIAHIEAGLRSFDRSMPEEINRIVTDHLADLLFVTEESALRNLRAEGIPESKVYFVGNTMIDSLLAYKSKATNSGILQRLGLRDGHPRAGSQCKSARYAVLTLHRPSNVDHRETLLNILEGLAELSIAYPVIFPAHPRTQKRVAEFGLNRFFNEEKRVKDCACSASTSSGLRMIDPLGYLDFLCLMTHAALIVTDSGGIQEESTCLGIPCVTVRENTERPITVEIGTNIVAGTSREGIRRAAREQLAKKATGIAPPAWDGTSAERILDVICREFEARFVRTRN